LVRKFRAAPTITRSPCGPLPEFAAIVRLVA
jgi:hypothetical protein